MRIRIFGAEFSRKIMRQSTTEICCTVEFPELGRVVERASG